MSGPLTSALKSGSKDLVQELNRRLAPAVGKYSVSHMAYADRFTRTIACSIASAGMQA